MKRVLLILFVLVFSLNANSFEEYKKDFSTYEKSELSELVVNEAKKTTTLPQKLDNMTYWTKLDAKGNYIVYTYEISLDSSEKDNISQLMPILKNTNIDTICKNDVLKALLANGIILTYDYKFKSNKSQAGTFNIDYNDCM